MPQKKKVLLIGIDGLAHYRIEMFNQLCEHFDLTIAHILNPLPDTKFKQLKVASKRFGPFFKIANKPKYSDYNAVIFSFNARILDIYQIIYSKRSFKLLFFGIGVSASYNNGYDENKKLDRLRKYLINKSDGAIFYEHYPLIKFQSMGVNPNKLHVAYNTVMTPTSFNFKDKTFQSFIFIGTLYKQKKIYDLLEAYLLLDKELGTSTPNLEIIGDGEEFDNIKQFIVNNNINDKVILHGKITDEKNLLPIFNRALACISPGQAGLSVQKCFAYGTPFITTKGAITGGELFCIIDEVNGFIYNGSINDLYLKLLMISNKTCNIVKVSKNAYNFYSNFRTPDIWANAFKKAII